jgi:multisubunit Na+/H+ antiporter MnhB subunit
MTCWARLAPRSAREVRALVTILLFIWLGVAPTVSDPAALSARNAASLGLAGTLVILCGGFAWARRFRRH